MQWKTWLAILLLLGLGWAQEEAAEDNAEGDNEKEDGEECEEAWEYLEFLKSDVK